MVDTGIMNVEKDYFSPVEIFCTSYAWFQDSQLLPTEKMIATSPSFIDIYLKKLPHIHPIDFIQKHKFKYWFYLLLTISLYVIVLNIKNRKSIFLLLLIFGIFLLLFVRDVDRVTIALIMLWALVLFESLKRYRKISIIFIFIFTSLYFYYLSPQLSYRYFKEITSAQKEAYQLIKKYKKTCEISLNYPTNSNALLGTIFLYNYLFHEESWLKMNVNEIQPRGWLARHPFFYQTHQISDKYTKRKYATYYDYLISNDSAFLGGKILLHDKRFEKYLLGTYDKLHLKDKPNCKHKTFIIAESEHFTLSQIRVECTTETQP